MCSYKSFRFNSKSLADISRLYTAVLYTYLIYTLNIQVYTNYWRSDYKVKKKKKSYNKNNMYRFQRKHIRIMNVTYILYYIHIYTRVYVRSMRGM